MVGQIFKRRAANIEPRGLLGGGGRLISSYVLIRIGVTKTLGFEHHFN